MATGIASGLSFLHQEGVIHSDMKSDNIVVSEDGEPLLADYGISRFMASFHSFGGTTTDISGSARWMAIELLFIGSEADSSPSFHSKESDVWAYGMVLYELLTGHRPYVQFIQDVHVALAIIGGQIPRPTPSLDSPEKQLLWTTSLKCWARISSHRPSMHEIYRALAHEDAPPASSNSDLLDLSSAFEKLRSSDTESCTETKTEGRHGRVPSLQVVPNRTFSVIGAGRTHSYGAPAGFVSGMESISFPPQTYEPAEILKPGSSAMSTIEHPMVPQTRYRPHTSGDQRRYVDEVNLQEPIYFFLSSPGGPKPGIPLRDAITSKFMRLNNRDEQLFQGCGPSISVRLLWKGYQPWSRQIPTRDFRSPPGPITKAKLAGSVAKSVQRFIEEYKDREMEPGADLRWAVGPGKIDVDDLLLVSLVHVAMGSWQANLQLNRPLH